LESIPQFFSGDSISTMRGTCSNTTLPQFEGLSLYNWLRRNKAFDAVNSGG